MKEKGSATTVINLAVSMLFCAKLVEAQEDLHVELYNLPSERFNGAKGKVGDVVTWLHFIFSKITIVFPEYT